jgi:lysophospholipase L1-like esterase
MQFALAQHQTSKPINVKAGSAVVVTPAAGATALVEYTSDTFANIENGSAIWAAWSFGKVTAATRDICASTVHARITVEGGSAAVDIHTIDEDATKPLLPSLDYLGGQSGIIGGDSRLIKSGSRRPYTALVAGDSITAFGEANIAVTSITDNGDGTATVVKSSHLVNVGQPCRMNVTAQQATNVMDSSVVAVIDANTIKIALGGRTHKVTGGGSPNIVLPWRRGSRGWFSAMESYLGVPFQATWCAVGGATSSQIADLLDATPQAEIADLGFVCIGMNDIYALGTDFPTTQAAVKKLIDKVRARSTRMVIIAVPPRNSADSANWTSAKQAVHTKLTRWQHQYAQQIGALFYDPSGAVWNGVPYMNPAATNPDPNVSMMFDFTHPAHPAAKAMGYGIGALLAPDMGVKGWRPTHRSQIGTDTGNLLVNADFSASTAGVANTWTISSVTTGLNVTPSIAARSIASGDSDAIGFNQVITANYGTASGLGLLSFQRSGIQALLTPGSTIQWRMLASVANAIGLLALEITISGIVSGTTTWQVYGNGLDGNLKPVAGAFSEYLMTPPAVVPAGLTSCNIFVRAIIDSTQTTDVTIKFAQPEMLVLG